MIWLLALIAGTTLLNAASFIWNLYEIVWWYDKAVHIVTTLAFTAPLPLLLYNRVLQGKRRYRILLLIVTVCLGMALGSIWEILEWGASQIWGDPNLREPRRDVVTDLIADGIGAFGGALLGFRVLDRAQRG